MPQILLRVYFMDDTHKTVYVDPVDTTVEKLWEIVSAKLLLSPQSAECFFIWQISKELEILLFSDQTIQDAYEQWGHLVHKYGQKRTLTDDIKAVASAVVHRPELDRSPTKINLQRSQTTASLKHTPSPPSEKGGFLSRAPSLLRSPSLGFSKATSLTRSTSRVGNLEDGEVEAFKLVYRPTSVLPLAVEHSLQQPEAVHLFFVQAVHHVVHSNYPCLTQTAVILAGVQLQIQLGDQKPEHLEHIKEALSSYIPEHLRDKRKNEEWVHDIHTAHQLHKGKDPLALKKAYLEVVQQWPFYGCTFFRAKGVPSQTSFFKQEYQGTVVVGVNHIGIHLIHPRALKFETWKFQDLVFWDSSPASGGTFVVQVVTGNKQEPSRTYTLMSPQAELINDLMHDWSEEWKAQVQEKTGKRTSTSVAKASHRKTAARNSGGESGKV